MLENFRTNVLRGTALPVIVVIIAKSFAFSTVRIFYILHFLLSTFSTLHIFYILYFPHATFSTLPTLHSAFST